MIDQEDQRAVLLSIVKSHPAQRLGIDLIRVETAEPDRLIAAQAAVGLDGAPLGYVELSGIGFGSNDKERTCAGDPGEACKIQIAAIHNVDGASFDRQLVEDVDLVNRALGQSDERGNRAAQIQQGMQFDCRLGGPKVGPRKEDQARVDHGSVERIDRLLQLEREGSGGCITCGLDEWASGPSRRICAVRDVRWHRPRCSSLHGRETPFI